MALRLRQLLGHAERGTAGQNGHLGDRVGVLAQHRYECVASLVNRDGRLLIAHQSIGPRRAAR
jgi:hypothetical protein